MRDARDPSLTDAPQADARRPARRRAAAPRRSGLRAAALRGTVLRVAVLRVAGLLLLAALLAWTGAPGAPGPLGLSGPAQAQGLDVRSLFAPQPKSSGGPDAAAEAGTAAGGGAPEAPVHARPPDLAAYGRLVSTGPSDDDDAAARLSMLRRTSENVSLFRQRLERMLSEASSGFGQLRDRLAVNAPDGRPGWFAGVALVSVILILIGRAVLQLFAIYVFRAMMVSAQRHFPPVGLTGKLPVIGLRMLLTVAGMAINLAVAAGLGLGLVEDHVPTQVTAGVIMAAYGSFWLIDTVWRMILNPYLPEYRIPRIGDHGARRLYLWLSALTAITVISRFYTTWLTEMGVDVELIRLNHIVVNLLILILILALIWTNRATVSQAIRHGRPIGEVTWIAAIGARIWAPLITIYFLVAWMEESVRIVMGLEAQWSLLAGAFITLLVALAVQAAGLYAVERIFARSRALRGAAEGAGDAQPEAPLSTPPAPGAPPPPLAPAPSSDAAGDAPAKPALSTESVGAAPPTVKADATPDPAPLPDAPATRAAAETDAAPAGDAAPERAAEPRPGATPLRPAAPGESMELISNAPRAGVSGDDGEDGDDGDEEGGGPMHLPPEVRPHAGERAEAEAAEVPGYRRTATMRTFEDLARRVVSLFSLGAGVYVLILIWGGQEMFADGSFFDDFQDVIDTLFLGYIAFHAVRIWLDQKIAEEGVDDVMAEPGDEGGGASATSRLGTLLPLFRAGILIVIGGAVAVIVATELGVNVAPLFAGAGIVGIAIGFGAQTLVRDILSGMFFLLDDAFRKGEYIDVGEVKGTVEKISLRSFQLRHHLGALNTIPFGEIKHLTNFSRDWVMMKLPLRLTYDTDVEKVRKLIKKLGQELLEHPTEGHKFVQPLKSQGVYMMEDSAMIIRVKYMTRPGDQWTTRKLVYQRIRELFEQQGIHFAHREVTVRLPDLPDRSLSPEEQRAVGAAARRAIEEDDGQQPSSLAAAITGR
ncbi:mechanosensitive ion channel family protein [Albimonas sp. CAU 1670]|uniref:mechanosensitive ion channel family protein n=1 Tax=Albimonas sp. CAU 1670 TaxID=3032599 RepID=UPI0023DC4B93|nr:mechanosensitive ion channel family protein [Albimonas sp. CAU 1670]MDF2234301.1 mechanosensitive ion channel family protein [Albimonas sp. CAU 1670]